LAASRRISASARPRAKFLYRLLTDEVARREAKRLDVRLRRAIFEHAKRCQGEVDPE